MAKWSKVDDVPSQNSTVPALEELAKDIQDFLDSDDEIWMIEIDREMLAHLKEAYNYQWAIDEFAMANKYTESIRHYINYNDLNIKVRKRGTKVYIIKEVKDGEDE